MLTDRLPSGWADADGAATSADLVAVLAQRRRRRAEREGAVGVGQGLAVAPDGVQSHGVGVGGVHALLPRPQVLRHLQRRRGIAVLGLEDDVARLGLDAVGAAHAELGLGESDEVRRLLCAACARQHPGRLDGEGSGGPPLDERAVQVGCEVVAALGGGDASAQVQQRQVVGRDGRAGGVRPLGACHVAGLQGEDPLLVAGEGGLGRRGGVVGCAPEE